MKLIVFINKLYFFKSKTYLTEFYNVTLKFVKVKIGQSYYEKLAVVIVVKETGTRCPHSQRLRRHGVSVAVVNENDYMGIILE